MLITPNEILISFENSTVFQIKLDDFHQICAEIFAIWAIICFGCNFANWLSEMKIMNEIVEIASKVGCGTVGTVQCRQAPVLCLYFHREIPALTGRLFCVLYTHSLTY